MSKEKIVKPLTKVLGKSVGKAGKIIVQNINPLELAREFVVYKKIAEEQHTERKKIIAKRFIAISAIEAEKEVILTYFKHRFKERGDALKHLFEVLTDAVKQKNDNAMDKALEGIVGIVKDNPLKDFDNFRKARLEERTIEINAF